MQTITGKPGDQANTLDIYTVMRTLPGELSAQIHVVYVYTSGISIAMGKSPGELSARNQCAPSLYNSAWGGNLWLN